MLQILILAQTPSTTSWLRGVKPPNTAGRHSLDWSRCANTVLKAIMSSTSCPRRRTCRSCFSFCDASQSELHLASHLGHVSCDNCWSCVLRQACFQTISPGWWMLYTILQYSLYYTKLYWNCSHSRNIAWTVPTVTCTGCRHTEHMWTRSFILKCLGTLDLNTTERLQLVFLCTMLPPLKIRSSGHTGPAWHAKPGAVPQKMVPRWRQREREVKKSIAKQIKVS